MTAKRLQKGVLNLRWIYAYEAVLRHRDYDAAAAELRLPARSVQNDVGSLEDWLRIKLVGGREVPFYINEFDAPRLTERLFRAIRCCEAAQARLYGDAGRDLGAIRPAKLYLRIDELETLSSIAGPLLRWPQRARVRGTLERSSDSRHVRKLENAFGAKLFVDSSLSKLTPAGAYLARILRTSTKAMRSARFLPKSKEKLAEVRTQREVNKARHLLAQAIRAQRHIELLSSKSRVTSDDVEHLIKAEKIMIKAEKLKRRLIVGS